MDVFLEFISLIKPEITFFRKCQLKILGFYFTNFYVLLGFFFEVEKFDAILKIRIFS